MEESTTAVVIEESTNVLRALTGASLVLLGFFILAVVLRRGVMPLVKKRFHEEKHPVIAILLHGFQKPVRAYLRVACVLCVLLVLAAWLPTDFLPSLVESALLALEPLLVKALRIAAVVAVTWGLVQSSDITGLILKGARKQLDVRTGKSVAQFLSAIFKVVVVAVAVVILLSELSYDINGLIAGLGLGGLTIALAAQSSAANFFGGLVIVVEKPFEIGDYIVTPDFEGSVEEINLRSCRIRTPDGALTTVPNSTLSDNRITNWTGDIQRRRTNHIVGLTYSTPREAVVKLTAQIREMLNTVDGVEKDTCIVRFTDFGASSLNLTVIYYTDPAWAHHMELKETVNVKIMELVEACPGAAFAFPTRVVHIEKDAGDTE